MATVETQTVEQVDKVSLRVFVDKKREKVVYAEAGKDFVDVLFSFLTLPLGTIARLVAEESNIEPVRVGSMSSLYQSVADLKEEHLWTNICKEMLLKPRNSMEAYCRQLKLNIDDTEPMQYLRCESWECNRKESLTRLSTFKNQKCFCGKVMDREVSPECLNLENGFVKEAATFIICEDLYVVPNVFETVLHLLQKYGVHDIDAIEEQTVEFSKKEVVDLLKLSLLSKEPLTDVILKKKQFHGNSNLGNQSEFGIRNVVSSDEDRQVDLKVMVRKSSGDILFAEAGEDFADFLFSFLTFPLGGVLHMLEGFSSLSCIDNLYKSMTELSPDRYLISRDFKDKLTKPQIAPQFELSNQILPIGASSLPVHYCHTCNNKHDQYHIDLTKELKDKIPVHHYTYYPEMFVPFNLVDPKFSSSKSSSGGVFAKGPSMYMVTDDLVVTPKSSVSAMSYLNGSKVPLFDLEVKVIKIGLKEGLCILKACLTSTSALTTGLNQFIRTIKEEK